MSSVKQLAYNNWDQCYEMHDGQIVALASGTANHGTVGGNIHAIFKNFLKGKPCKVWQGSIDVHLTKNDYFVPDVVVVCNQDIIADNGIFGAPDLVVEILSPSTNKYDRGYKKNLYEKCGIKEYWIVLVETRTIEVYLLRDGKLELDNVYSILSDYEIKKLYYEGKDIIAKVFSPSMFSDLVVSLEEVFADLI